MQNTLTQEDWNIRNEILRGSYKENYNFSKELYFIKSSKATNQWLESRKILSELLTHQKLKK